MAPVEVQDYTNSWMSTGPCNIVTCEVRPVGCTGSYSGGKLSINSNFKVMAIQTVAAGYSEQVCVSCKDSANNWHNTDS